MGIIGVMGIMRIMGGASHMGDLGGVAISSFIVGESENKIRCKKW